LAKLKKLPYDVVEPMKDMAMAAAWHAANTRKGYKGDATGDRIKFNNDYQTLLQNARGLGIGHAVFDNIKWLAWNAAWHAANSRTPLHDAHAKKDKESANKHLKKIKEAGVFSDGLLDHITGMIWAAAWYTANTRANFAEDAKSDMHTYNNHIDKMGDEAVLADVKFHIDRRFVGPVKPVSIHEQEIDNRTSGVTGSQTVTITSSETYTKHWNHHVGFTLGIKSTTSFETTIKAVDVTQEIEVSFEASYGHEWGSGESKTAERTYEFHIDTAGQQHILAEGIVQQADLNIPYTIVYKMGDVTREVQGEWQGVGYSRVLLRIYELDENGNKIDKVNEEEGVEKKSLSI
jgi:hypothetical protein